MKLKSLMNKTKRKHPHTVIGAFEFKDLKRGHGSWCQVKHDCGVEKKFASYALYVLGIPAGYLCKKCKKEWKQIYERESSIDYD